MTFVLCGTFFADSANAQQSASAGAVFTMTNGVLRNDVVMYNRSADGHLQYTGSYPTGGRGSGGTDDPLQSQYSLVLSPDHQWLMAANSATSDISVFRVSAAGLQLTSVTPAGGSGPISLALYNNLLYVVNFTGNYHTAGFRVSSSGQLQIIPGSRQPLSTLDTGASTIAFSPDGKKLVVSERIANKVDVFDVAADGTLANPVYNASAGTGAFGLQFTTTGILLVTETNGGPPNPGTISSYKINADNTVQVISAKADGSGQASCWVQNNGTYAWVSNTASGNVGALAIGVDGSLTPIGSVAAPDPGAHTIDLVLTPDNKFLYVLFSALGEVIGYSVGDGGQLVPVQTVNPGRPSTGFVGLAAY